MSQKVSFLDKIKDMKLSSFEWVQFIKDVSSPDKDGNKATIITFELENPIARVTSSNSEYDPNSRARVHDFRTDVVKVKCNLDVIEKNAVDFAFDEDKEGKLTGAGKYRGDLFLDLSRAGEVWLTDVKFSKMGVDMKISNRNERFSSILKKYEDEQATKKAS